MLFFKTVLLGLAALSSAVAAQSKSLYFTANPADVTVGRQMQITYMAPSIHEPVTIKLRKGTPDNLKTIAVLTKDATGGKFSWTPSTELQSGSDYALQITQGSEDNYTSQFSVDNPKGITNSIYRATPITSMSATFTGHAGTMSSGASIPMTRNATFSSATLSATKTSFSARVSTAPAPSATTSNAAATLSSNFGLVLGAAAALAYLA